MTETRPSPLRKFADFVREQRTRLTEQWMKAVFGDTDLVEADKLTYQQLADHLPEILEGLCRALDVEDLERVEPAIERNARKHGMIRWRQGYRIEELVRELDLFHRVLSDALEEFAGQDSTFTRRHENRARRLVAETFSMVTVTSIREVVSERDRKIDEYTGRLERANHELTLKQRLVGDLYESRMQITRSVVHDLRNFLNAFSIALQLIERAPSKADMALTLANRQASDMKQLVDQMVEYSVVLGESTQLTREPVDVHALYDELVASSRPAIEAKGLKLRATFDPALSTVTSNRLKLKQIAVNLLSNATKYTKSGEIELAFAAAGAKHWSIRVSDTGVGIAPSDTDRVFDEFERAAGEDIPGTGLGLAIVKELCRVLSGQIDFASREGVGTTFEIRFPLELAETE
ncbi:Adaptive-response sensory-kinase SasA [Paraburkholderia domus]|uniref:histidine kinase n=1 Tax=Paraburkholderia domus TaxID=2793075 RepID=A0A9N8N2V5_9BURK|nr:sensor histidine kinase [Paraburkholderia domus]MBK5050180.1 sensor histidine kinase [Burkholderia sp. R-70006]MBK5062533.1 sensor histidine kinase [Burkholderia sp. R-70199]MBK5088679.1 sensor histidine kinase [Burkholderia sp. R-69927]MBK5118800.1 sensor histidine kinase [Burkholderia sp. R-69980]MBK5168217.1 sensor histidine kinase [Burkholderia sp. R-70211]MBK5181667.1 sensor histidine kinase [Burkholderia sp. R-69749]MCI0144820.1 RsbRD N-terminal domain-containing protein [Paraburkho